MGRFAVLVWMVVMEVAVVACGDENTAPDSASVPGADAPPDPRTTVLVSPSGDDANDGLGSPVRTLGRGIAIARSNTAIRTIALAAGRYDVATGELFPYTVPANVTIAGPAGGGTLLVGQGLQRGLAMSDGKLADLELQSFTVAVTVAGTAELSNLRVRSSETAILAEQGTGTLTLTAVDIDGMFQPCPVGVEIHVGHLDASEISVRSVGAAFKIMYAGSAAISNASVTGAPTCDTAVVSARTSTAFTLTDSIIDGGQDGISVGSISMPNIQPPTIVTLTNTIVRNMARSGIVGGVATLTMTGGELSNNGVAGLATSHGTSTLNNVAVTGNGGVGIVAGAEFSPDTPATLSMRGCTITNNGGDGVHLSNYAIADLGTVASPGNNTLRAGDMGVGLDIAGTAGGRLITAVGNTWRPNFDGANAAGKYTTIATVPGPVLFGVNFEITTGWSLQR